MEHDNRPQTQRTAWALLIACLLVAFGAVAYPMYVIRPFRAQGARELALALVVRDWGSLAGWICALIAIACVALIWKGARRARGRAFAAIAGALALILATLTHVNVFEILFHRIDNPQSISASEAVIEADDMVLAIRVEGSARAYPVRMMGYHHIVNDVVGRSPVVATY